MKSIHWFSIWFYRCNGSTSKGLCNYLRIVRLERGLNNSTCSSACCVITAWRGDVVRANINAQPQSGKMIIRTGYIFFFFSQTISFRVPFPVRTVRRIFRKFGLKPGSRLRVRRSDTHGTNDENNNDWCIFFLFLHAKQLLKLFAYCDRNSPQRGRFAKHI